VVRPQVGKIEAIKNAERPMTKKQVRSFLGLVGWYRKFVPNFSARAVALTNLTKKCHPNKVNWTMDCEKAFQDLKDSLCKEPLLQSPDFEQLFTVQTDASEHGLGAVLLQGEQGHLKPIAYISRKLLPRETRYSTVEKECLAIGRTMPILVMLERHLWLTLTEIMTAFLDSLIFPLASFSPAVDGFTESFTAAQRT